MRETRSDSPAADAASNGRNKRKRLMRALKVTLALGAGLLVLATCIVDGVRLP
jgi:hypothetical protein